MSADGFITIEANAKPATYEFKVNVVDNKRNENAESSVRIVVKELSDLAFKNQAAIRIAMVDVTRVFAQRETIYESPDAFLRKGGDGRSPHDKFVQLLEEKLDADLKIERPNIEVFSIKPSPYDPTIDVRFTVATGRLHT